MKARTDGPEQPTGTTRRRPVQRRSLERYERLLDACAGLLDEVGAAGLTTKEVALRARVPIGTLYQFFSGKESLLAALAERNLDRYLDRLARRMTAEGPPAAAGFVDLAVEEFVAMKRSVPGFGHLDFGLVDAVPPGLGDERHLLDAELDNNAAVAARLRAVGGRLFEAPGFALSLRVALECADAVLKLAFRVDPEGDPALIAECKRLLRCYLSEPAAG
ncbi:TetR/AcrR family transcriptional regulator [Kitasatospora camelliae]|uniref:TetR/AcrR family transcriptional regulator n=1 Tax=Kitasatospora camelliae TaxID=3156397 RepID=A0AAU8JTB1_9ACTN